MGNRRSNNATTSFAAQREHDARMHDLAGKPLTSLAQRAWAAEREWRRAKKLDVMLKTSMSGVRGD
jgi:hypothetical protein